jgi:hypothetical protein
LIPLTESTTSSDSSIPKPDASCDSVIFIGNQIKQSYRAFEISFQSLCYFINRLVLCDVEFRKMTGENLEKRSQSSDDFSSQNKVIHLILLYGTNQSSLSNVTISRNESSSSSAAILKTITADLEKAIMIRQKLCLLQMICLLSIKYYKDPRYLFPLLSKCFSLFLSGIL